MIRPFSTRFRRTLFGAVAAPLLTLFVAPTAAHADDTASSANLSCTITLIERVYPGLSAEGGANAATTNGLTGTADCTGTVDGATVTGTGSYGTTSNGFGDCASGSGSLTFVLKVPTTSGEKTVAGRGDVSYVGTDVNFSGDLQGTGAFTPLEGDCVNTPLTALQAELDVDIHI